jgi:isopentenyl diphosphate isomerase/L-lactate dehydrogenase-like FMN-dependent dehydrogenase
MRRQSVCGRSPGHGGLQAGVESYIDKIKIELEQAMVLTGVKKASQVPGNIIFRSE